MNTKVLTGNELLSGDVVWWGADGWTARLEDAVGLEKAEGEELLAAEQARARINDLALVDVRPCENRTWWPLKIRERIRGLGPTVRADLVPGGDAALRIGL